MLFKNVTKRKISTIIDGNVVNVRPDEIVEGPEHLKKFSNLKPVSYNVSKEYRKVINIKETALEENIKECDRILEELELHDFTSPYTKDNYKKSQTKKNFSIIILSHTKEQFIDFVRDLREQQTNQTFEIIWLRNSQNEFKSCAEALNFGMDLANSEYYALVHQDLRCNETWISKIREHFDHFDKSSIRYGFLGVAGTGKSGKDVSSEYGAIYLSNDMSEIDPDRIKKGKTFADINRARWGRFKEVQILDECAMFCKSTLGIRYDEKTFDHYHWYGADICLQSLHRGFKNFAIDADCTHLSDGQQNLSKKEHVDSFIRHGSRLFKKWHNVFSYFRSTTSSFYSKENYWLPLILKPVNRRFGTSHPSKIIVK